MANKAGVMSKPQVLNNFWDCGKQMSLNGCMSQDGETSQNIHNLEACRNRTILLMGLPKRFQAQRQLLKDQRPTNPRSLVSQNHPRFQFPLYLDGEFFIKLYVLALLFRNF